MTRLRVGDLIYHYSGENPRIQRTGIVIEILENAFLVKDQRVKVCFQEGGKEEIVDFKRSEIVFAAPAHGWGQVTV